MPYSDDDKSGKMGFIGERAVVNALKNYRLCDYLSDHERLFDQTEDPRIKQENRLTLDNYQQGGGLDARRELVYYTVYSTRGKQGEGQKKLQGMEVDLVEEWMYADDMKPHKKAHEVKGELASIQEWTDKQGNTPRDVTKRFSNIVFNYGRDLDWLNMPYCDEIHEAQRLHGTGNVFVETKQGNGKGWAYIIRDTAEELKQMGFDEGRDVWSAAIVWNNREIEARIPGDRQPGKEAVSANAEPLNTMVLLAMPQQFIIDGVNGNFKRQYFKDSGYRIPLTDIFSISDAIKASKHPEAGKIRWGWTDPRTGARLYEDEGVLASFKGIDEKWSEADKIIPLVRWCNIPLLKTLLSR